GGAGGNVHSRAPSRRAWVPLIRVSRPAAEFVNSLRMWSAASNIASIRSGGRGQCAPVMASLSASPAESPSQCPPGYSAAAGARPAGTRAPAGGGVRYYFAAVAGAVDPRVDPLRRARPLRAAVGVVGPRPRREPQPVPAGIRRGEGRARLGDHRRVPPVVRG